MQSSPPFPPHPRSDDAPTARLPRVGHRRSLLGSATFVVVLLGAALAVFPATAAAGLLLCLLAIAPAVVAFLRSRRGRARGNSQALAAMVMAPVFFVVAAVVLAATAPQAAKTPVSGTVAAASPAADQAPESSAPAASAPAVAEQAVAPVVGPAPAIAPVPAIVAQPVVVAPAAPRRVDAAPAAPQRVIAAPAAPRRVIAAPAAPQRVVAAPAAPQQVVAAPAPEPRPAPAAAPQPAPQPVVEAAPTCNEGTHYVNSSGNCVLRPVAAASAPAGATAKCGDGVYSFSQHRSGTCSGHGGVAAWL